jgi:hypothetical protein
MRVADGFKLQLLTRHGGICPIAVSSILFSSDASCKPDRTAQGETSSTSPHDGNQHVNHL